MYKPAGRSTFSRRGQTRGRANDHGYDCLPSNGVMRITMNRPDKNHALTGSMYDAMTAAMERADASDDDIRAPSCSKVQTARSPPATIWRIFSRPDARRRAGPFHPKIALLERRSWRRSTAWRWASGRRCCSIAISSTRRRPPNSACPSSISDLCRRRPPPPGAGAPRHGQGQRIYPAGGTFGHRTPGKARPRERRRRAAFWARPQ